MQYELLTNEPQVFPLAIVIPAYKDTFLRRTLQSLAEQTCKDFTVYIGDDSSPHDLAPIVEEFEGRFPMCYHRFGENLGGRDVVAQWTRCVAMTRGEEWIWLFSDDDFLSPDCVEAFYREIRGGAAYDIYRFNIQVVGRDDKPLRRIVYPEVISSYELYRRKLLGGLECYVVEFVFSRAVYERAGGFVPFDLAWGSDLATWVNFGMERGIRTLPGGTVSWRSSGENISTLQTKETVERKVGALLAFFRWGEKAGRRMSCPVRWINDWAFVKRLAVFSRSLSAGQTCRAVVRYARGRFRAVLLLGVLGAAVLACRLKGLLKKKRNKSK